MRTYEGVIEIPLEDYNDFIRRYLPNPKDNLVIGPPRANKGNQTIEVSFAGSGHDMDECSPLDWGVPPKAKLEWDWTK